jgi:hypothetical protein
MAGYYDYVLALIPLSMLAVAGLLTLGGWSLLTAAPAGAGVSALVIGHALFVRAPVDTVADEAPVDAPAVDAPAVAAD